MVRFSGAACCVFAAVACSTAARAEPVDLICTGGGNRTMFMAVETSVSGTVMTWTSWQTRSQAKPYLSTMTPEALTWEVKGSDKEAGKYTLDRKNGFLHFLSANGKEKEDVLLWSCTRTKPLF